MDYLFALQSLREISPEFITYFFVFVSEYLLKGALVASGIIFWCCDKREGSAILLGYAGTYQVNQIIKNIACVYRPWIIDSRLHVASGAAETATGYSFPSGHTVTAVASYGGIGVWQKKRKWFLGLMIFAIILTAFSRNWLGAHTLSDVIVAVIEAGVVLVVINLLKLYMANHPEKDTIIMIFGIAFTIIMLFVMEFKSYPVDYDAAGNVICEPFLMLKDCYTAAGIMTGGLLGWWLERHFVNFSMQVSKKTLIWRGVIGTASFGLVYLLSGLIFSAFIPAHFDHLVKYFFVFFYVFYIYPLCFTAVEKKINK